MKKLQITIFAMSLAAISARAQTFDDPSVAPYWYGYESTYDANGYTGGGYINPITVSGGHASVALPSNGAPVGNNVSSVLNWLFVYDDGSSQVESLYDGSLLGNLSSRIAFTATFRLTLSTPAGTTLDPSQLWYETPGAPPTARFLFEAYDAALYGRTGVTPDLHWWSNPGAVDLTTMANGEDYTLTVNLNPALWSDDYGLNGTNDVAGFEYTLANVLDSGLSFGGGSGFQNGVALMPGVTGSFDLSNLTTVPEPTSLALVAMALGGLMLIRRRK